MVILRNKKPLTRRRTLFVRMSILSKSYSGGVAYQEVVKFKTHIKHTCGCRDIVPAFHQVYQCLSSEGHHECSFHQSSKAGSDRYQRDYPDNEFLSAYCGEEEKTIVHCTIFLSIFSNLDDIETFQVFLHQRRPFQCDQRSTSPKTRIMGSLKCWALIGGWLGHVLQRVAANFELVRVTATLASFRITREQLGKCIFWTTRPPTGRRSQF